MKDKEQDMKQASVGRADDAPRAADALTADAPQLPPLSNRGGTESEDAGAFQEAFECYETYILDGKGNLLGVPLRRGVSDSAFIDQISFSFHEKTFFDKYGVRVSLIYCHPKGTANNT